MICHLVVAVGLASSSRSICDLCVLPFAHVFPLMVPSLFSVWKIELSIACFLSKTDKFSSLMGSNTTLSWSCFISLIAASFPFTSNCLTPLTRLYVWAKEFPKLCSYTITPEFIMYMIFAITCASSAVYPLGSTLLVCRCI